MSSRFDHNLDGRAGIQHVGKTRCDASLRRAPAAKVSNRGILERRAGVSFLRPSRPFFANFAVKSFSSASLLTNPSLRSRILEGEQKANTPPRPASPALPENLPEESYVFRSGFHFGGPGPLFCL